MDGVSMLSVFGQEAVLRPGYEQVYLISWKSLESLARVAFGDAVKKWCDPDDMSLNAQDYMLEDAIKNLRAKFCAGENG